MTKQTKKYETVIHYSLSAMLLIAIIFAAWSITDSIGRHYPSKTINLCVQGLNGTQINDTFYIPIKNSSLCIKEVQISENCSFVSRTYIEKCSSKQGAKK